MKSVLSLKPCGLPKSELAFENATFMNTADLEVLAGTNPDEIVYISINDYVFVAKPSEFVERGTVAVGMLQRMSADISMSNPLSVTRFHVPKSASFVADEVVIEVKTVSPRTPSIDVDAATLTASLKEKLGKQVWHREQQIAVIHDGMRLKLRVSKMLARADPPGDAPTGEGSVTAAEETLQALSSTDPPGDAPTEGGSVTAAEETVQALFSTISTVTLRAGGDNVKLRGSASGRAKQVFKGGFDFVGLGIGGLDAEFGTIFRRAFASRLYPAKLLERMGQRHVRGMLLHGPPGCGKTLIARQIGKALNAHPPKIVNGPEVLNKYVGQAEENIRNLFAAAEAEQASAGDDSELHIIIFDEIDAICKQRGSVSSGTGVHDTVVNQLLTKIDGVESLNNVLIIGMTNRKDLIDDALLRPGRLELHVEIGLPDAKGRGQILSIHTAAMKEHGHLARDVDLNALAVQTKNFTGAEIEGLVKAASSFAFARHVDPTRIEGKLEDIGDIVVGHADFERALTEVKPAFGIKDDELRFLYRNGIVNYGPDFEHIQSKIQHLVNHVRASSRTSITSVILHGPSGCGKTALSAMVGVTSGFPFVKRVGADNLVGRSDTDVTDALVRAFADAFRSPLSIIILDDIERMINYADIGPRFSNSVLQTLLVLLKRPPPPGHKLLVLGTTSIPSALRRMELMDVFNVELALPMIAGPASVLAVLKAERYVDTTEMDKITKLDMPPVGIKTLLLVLDMAREKGKSGTSEGVEECLGIVGIGHAVSGGGGHGGVPCVDVDARRAPA